MSFIFNALLKKHVKDPLPPDPLLIQPHRTIIVGLSGGPDSVCLLHVLAQQQNKNLYVIAAHLNHEWQESASQAEELCRNICAQLNITLIVKKISELTISIKWNGSKEEVGRILRRHFFQTIAQEYNAHAIALAHHQQDQQETFFIRLIRGSSLKGLTGMSLKEGLYIRPLLHWTKQNITDYITKHHLPFYIDPTNTSNVYLRNRIRNQLIPVLENIDIRSCKNIISTMEQLSLAHDFIQKQTDTILMQLQNKQGIDLVQFLQQHTVIQHNILLKLMIDKHLSFTPSQKLFKEIMRFLEKSKRNKHILYQTWIIQKNKSFFYIEKIIKNDKNLLIFK